MNQAATRDPINPRAVGMIVTVYLSHYSPESYGEAETPDEEVDMDLESVLLEQGVISPVDVIEWVAPHFHERLINIGLESGEVVQIDVRGEVDTFPAA